MAVCVVNQTAQPFVLAAGTEVGQASLSTVGKDIVDLDTVVVKNPQTNDVALNVRTVSTESYEDFVHLQPVLDMLPTQLTHLKREEAITFIRDTQMSSLKKNLI